MNDLERDLRMVLEREADDAPTPHETRTAVRRTRRRQLRTVAAASLGVVAAVAVAVAGFRSFGAETDGLVPASTTQTLNGITITHPQTWQLIDPDEAGLNGPGPTDDLLPRLILVLSPTDPGEALGCPGLGQAPGPVPTFVMTVQETPLALSGDAARPWPVELQPLEIDGSESACYPGWTFSQATWTAAGRSFDARIGIAPEASDADREALLGAFASMTFEPAENEAAAAILDTGEIGGETWELVASGGEGGLELSIDTTDSSTGMGGLASAGGELAWAEQRVGEGSDERVLVFGPVPARTTGLQVFEGDTPESISLLDVPEHIGERLDAFLLVLEPGQRVTLDAVDDAGDVVGTARVFVESGDPVETPLPEGELADGRHFGFVRSVDVSGRTIEFDLAYWLSGEEANEAYQEATGETGPVPNDHFVVNDNPRLRTLPLSPDLRLVLLDWNDCCDQTFVGDLELFAEAIGLRGDVVDGNLIYRGYSQWWITVEGGVVTKIEEQYSP